MRFLYLLFFTFSIILAWSCDTSDIAPDRNRLGYNFFPLKEGAKWIYDIQTTEYELSEDPKVTNLQLRESIVDSFVDQSGDTTYIIYRYTRANDLIDWEFKETWTAKRTENEAIVFEGTVPFLKISFPVVTGKVWDGNVLNTMEQDDYQSDSLFFEYQAPDTTYANTLTVVQSDNQDLILELNRRYEVYGLNIGLVFKEERILQFCTDENCLGQQIIQSGREVKQRLITYEEN